MSGINLAGISSKTLLGATFAQAVYPNKGGAPFTPPADFKAVDFKFTSSQTGFAAQAYVNVKTGELVIAYRGSDSMTEAGNAATWARDGIWDPQFTDATNFAAAARTAALVKVNEYRLRPENGLQPLTQLPDDKILVTGHSLGGLLGQVVSKMFGWSAQVYDSLGGGKLVYGTDPATGQQVFSAGFTEQATKLGLTAGGKVVDHDVSGKIQNWGTSIAAKVGQQLGVTVDIPAMGQAGMVNAVAVVPVLGWIVAYLGNELLGKHDKFAIEAAMYSLAELGSVLGNVGPVQVRVLRESQITGESVPEGSNERLMPAVVDSNGKVLARYEANGKGFAAVVLEGAQAGTVLQIGRSGEASNSDVRITRINADKSESLYTRDQLIEKHRKPGADYLVKTTEELPGGGFVQETTLADGSKQYDLLSDKGTPITLASDEYIGHTADDAVAKFKMSGDGSTEGGIILSGERAGETFTRTWRNGNPALNMGLADDGSGRHLDYIQTTTDKNGRTLTADSRPEFEGTGSGKTLVGVQVTQSLSLNGIKQQERVISKRLDASTQQQTDSQDITLYNAQGQFVGRSFASKIKTTSGIDMGGLSVSYDSSGKLTATALTERLDGNVLRTTVRNPQGATVQAVDKQTLDDGSSVEVKTENGQQYVRVTDTDSKTSDWKNLTTGQTQTAEQRAQRYENQLYSDMAGFLGAMRSKDKLGQVLYGAKIAIDFQLKNGATEVKLGDLNLGKAVAGLSATVGIVAGLNALQSKDTLTQLNGAVGLLSSANNLAGVLGTKTAGVDGFLSGEGLKLLSQAGALLSIANLKNLDKMLENGQVGSAAATVVGAINDQFACQLALGRRATDGSGQLVGRGLHIGRQHHRRPGGSADPTDNGHQRQHQCRQRRRRLRHHRGHCGRRRVLHHRLWQQRPSASEGVALGWGGQALS
jgi:hypothetical protein